MTSEQLLAGLQEEVRGLSEPVQRLSSENETLRSQSTVGAVRTVTMANEVARLNKPAAFSGTEEEFSDWDFAMTCFVGTMNGTQMTELQAVAADPMVKRIQKNGARSTEQNGYEAYRSLVLRYGSRDAHGETTLLIKVMHFNFGDIGVMESKFEEFNLPIKDPDNISNVLGTIKRAILVARAPEPLRTHLPLNSQSYSNFLEVRQAINRYLKARKGFKLMERDDPMDVDFVHTESQKGKGKGKRNVQRQEQRKGQTKRERKEFWKGKSNQEKFQGTCRNCGKTGHTWSECWAKGGGAAKQANSVGETEKTADVNWIMMIQKLSVGQTGTSGLETWRYSGASVSCKSVHESQVFIHDPAHQLDTKPEFVNSVKPIILSNTARPVVDSGCFDHYCPLELATQFELKQGRLLNTSAAKHEHYGTRVVEGLTTGDVNGAEIPLKIRFNVFDVKSPLWSTSKLRRVLAQHW